MRARIEKTPEPPTCLFTGVALPPVTKVEHTIQAALGGRFQSRKVSSDRFNAKASAIDQALAQAYSPIFNRIGPLMPGGYKTPSVPARVQGEDGPFEIRGDGRFVRKGLHVKTRDPITNKPVEVYGSDVGAMQRHFGAPNAKPERVHSPPGATASFDVPLLNIEIEIAALKSILLTFDHLQGNDPNRFTRTPNVARARSLVTDFIMKGQKTFECYGTTMMGLQYDKIHRLRQLRRQVSLDATPFEHVMVASANVATKTLDVVWWIASIDPYGFRLCNDWSEGEFTCMVVSGVLANSGDIFKLAEGFSCKPEFNRRSGLPRTPSSKQLDALDGEISVHRLEALRMAVDLAERKRPEYVRDSVVEIARDNLQNLNDGRIVTALASYLERLFYSRLNDPANRNAFKTCVRQRTECLQGALQGEAVGSSESPRAQLAWDRWHAVYVQILDDLLPSIGPPGEFSSGGHSAEIIKHPG